MRPEGAIGLSSVTVEGLRRAVPASIACVQNECGLVDRRDAAMLALRADDPTGSDHRGDCNGDGGVDGALMKVISSMTMLDGYVHGNRATEHSRLVYQAGTLTALLHADTGYPPGARVLEAGCGVGAQTLTLAARSPGAHILAADSSATALDQARRRILEAGLGDAVALRLVDLADLPHDSGELAAATFDHVFVCFVLEHLPEPRTILERLRRVLRPGGTLTVIEGDHGSAYFHPDSAAARDAITCQITLQRQAGGDPLIGRRLRPLLADAGFGDIHVDPRTVYVDTDRPALVEGFTHRTFTAMIQGVREPAIAAGLTTAEHFDRGIADLQRTTADDGTFNYTFFKATAHRPRSQPA